MADLGWDLRAASTDLSSSVRESLCWKDPRGDCTISRLAGDVDVFRFRLGDVSALDVDFASKVIHFDPARQDSAAELHFLLDQVVPRLLAGEGNLVLHAALLEGSEAFAVIGDTGAGKSTLAGHFYKRGHRLHGDDVTIVRPGALGHSARSLYPSLRLLPDSLSQLFPAALTAPMAEYSAKRRVEAGSGLEFTRSEPNLAAIFLIDSSLAEPTVDIRRVSPAAACAALIENSFALDPSDTSEASVRMQQAALVADAVPVFELAYCRRFEVLDAVVDKVTELLTRISQPDFAIHQHA